MSTRQEVYAAIDSERDYQDKRWNATTTPTEGKHSVSEWVLFMEDYLAEARTQLSRYADPSASQNALHTIRKLAGMAVSCMEQNGAPHRVPTPSVCAKGSVTAASP